MLCSRRRKEDLDVAGPRAARSSPGWRTDNWFMVSDGKNTITVDHLSNGEVLPAVDMAVAENGVTCQSFIVTPNEVFVVKGLSASREDCTKVLETIGTIRILKYDTKTALPKNSETPAAGQTAAGQAAAAGQTAAGGQTAAVMASGQTLL